MSFDFQVNASVQADFSGINQPAAMNRVVGYECYQVIRAHLRLIGLNRHTTANRLGAKPTKFWSTTARAVTLDGATDTGFTIGVPNPAIGQAFHPVTIRPVKAKFLTIPISPLSYGKTVYEISRKYKVFRPKGKNILCAIRGRGKESKLVPLFALVKQVQLRRDPSLWPSDEELNDAASKGVSKYLNLVSRKGEQSNVSPA